MGQIPDTSAFELMAQAAAREIASGASGASGSVKILDLTPKDLPPALKTALNALGSGLIQANMDMANSQNP
jgi:hypothetical protein